jgi:hypothetical protein
VARRDDKAEKQLQGFRLLESFNDAFQRQSRRFSAHPWVSDPQRQVRLNRYLGLFLFGLLNPVVESMRCLCAATRFKSVQNISGKRISLGSFSEMQHLASPQLLEAIFQDLASQLENNSPGGPVRWKIVDSSLFEALPRMKWAFQRKNNSVEETAVRLHVSLDMITDAPVAAKVTRGPVCERKVWPQHWKKGQGEVGDRNYGQDYSLLRLLQRREGFFVVRLREKQVVFNLEEELALSAADRQAGVIRQGWGYLGSCPRYRSERVRVVWIQAANGQELMLATNQGPQEMPAEMVSLIYKNRWQVELFFRWVKCILGCRHFMAQSEQGVSIQLYLALIAALLIQLYTGRRPSKRMWEALQWFFMGAATAEELEICLQEELSRTARKNKISK